MGMSKYDELATQVLNYLDNRDWDSAYSLLKNRELQGDATAFGRILSQWNWRSRGCRNGDRNAQESR